MGLANDKSIARGIAKACAGAGAELAFSYQGEAFGKRLEPLAQSVGSDFMVDVDVTDELEGKAERSGGKGGSQSQSQPSGTADPTAWNSRTRKMYTMLKGAFGDSSDAPLSYNAMIHTTRNTAHKRKVVAGCFQELLFLTTHGIVELTQRKAYGNILVSKTELFDTVAAA